MLVVGEGGALISAVISTEGEGGLIAASGSTTTWGAGKGWKLQLAPGWKLIPGPRTGDFEIRQTAPEF